MIEKIISGGQTGADLGGLIAAKRLGIRTGGLAPKGYKTEYGSNPDLSALYGLAAAATDDYSFRTAANVKGSHATVIFATHAGSPGTRLTIKTCNEAKKPYKIINPFAPDAVELLVGFLTDVYARYGRTLIINVAGNRESKSPGIGERVVEVFLEGLDKKCP